MMAPAAWQDDGDGQFEPEGDDTLLAAYQYDGLGRRIRKTVGGAPGVTYDYYFNEDRQVLETRAGGAPDPLDRYVWDVRYAKAPVVRFRDGNTDGDYADEEDNVLYYTHDANWNTTALVDAATGAVAERYFYDAYGRPQFADDSWDEMSWSGSLQNEILYGGYGFDAESGLYHTDAREYHCTLGRFVQVDPLGPAAGPNVYAYCANSPVDTVDPSGLIGLEKVMQGLWGVGEGAIEILCGLPSTTPGTGNIALLAKGVADYALGLNKIREGFRDEAGPGAPANVGQAVGDLVSRLTGAPLQETRAAGMLLDAALSGAACAWGRGATVARGANGVRSANPTVANTTRGWKVGQPINNLTAKGNAPSVSTVRQRFWKNEAFYKPGKYKPQDLARMRHGLAPQQMNPETGVLESMHLHHNPPQSAGGLFDVEPMWPAQHWEIHYGSGR
ncbi:MAG: RHS repeat-associated core domain-containing protein [Planctomycetes bacterium]|nr:RHS repeat-associated core domain-containing protein [Planctomycetota bacterium]